MATTAALAAAAAIAAGRGRGLRASRRHHERAEVVSTDRQGRGVRVASDARRRQPSSLMRRKGGIAFSVKSKRPALVCFLVCSIIQPTGCDISLICSAICPANSRFRWTGFGAHCASTPAHSAAHAIGGGASTTARCSRRGTKRSRRPLPEPPALRASCGARGRENPREKTACSKDPTGGVANRPSRTHGRPPQARWRRPCARAGFRSPRRPCAAGWSRARPPAPRARPRDRAVTPGPAGRTECGWRWRPAFAARTDER